MKYSSNNLFKTPVNYDFSNCRRCAIVGNSGLLLDHRYGDEIDGHDCVVRFNAAPTEGFEQRVGTKTTFRVVNGPIMIGGSVSYVQTPTNWISSVENQRIILLPHRRKKKKRNFDKAEELAGDKNELIRITDEFENWVRKKAKNFRISKVSTGLKTILLFMNLTSQIVNLYGFGFHREKDLSKRHYWETFKHNSTGGHRWNRERRFVKKLAKNHKLNLKNL